MLKKTRVLFLGLVVLAGSACVTPTHASSADSVIVTHVRAGGVNAAKEELIVLYNTTSQVLDITDWCLTNKANVAFICFDPELETTRQLAYALLPHSYMTVASHEYVATVHTNSVFSFIYTVTNQSSGSLVGSADTVSIRNKENEIIGSASWSAPIPAGKVLSRMLIMPMPDMYAVNNDSTDWMIADAVPNLPDGFVKEYAPEDPGEEEPVDPIDPSTPSEPSNVIYPYITELLPNPAGTDTGNEFIEFYNPHTTNVLSLEGLRLRIGFDEPKWYNLPAVEIPPLGYYALTNQQVKYTLSNTSGKVQIYKGDVPVGESIEYSSPKDNEAWALIDSSWRYTTMPTPGTFNQASPDSETDETLPVSTQKPCASNQYRNPETGRCKLVASASTTQAACKAGQERNPETNRCRNVAGASTGPTPCKEGQERNPETNRCRTIVKMSNAGYPVDDVKEGESNQPGWYYWLALGGVVLSVLGYAVWEWREELLGAWGRAKAALGR